MSGPIFSAAWYRVAALTPRIRTNARIVRHQYRGETWYVLRDVASDRVYRFTTASYLVLGLMDGRRTVQQIWDAAVERLGDDAPTQDEMIVLLSQLHAADVLQCDVPPDAAELFRRGARLSRRMRLGQWLSPLAWRFHLLDPEPLLRPVVPALRPLFGPIGLVLWLAVVLPGLALMAVHWDALTKNLLDSITTPQTALLLWLLFPVIKVLHEFGHAAAIKAYGGEVHDMGIMFLVFTPIPYVDASASTAVPGKWRRFVVGGAGMMVELVIASVAVYVWATAQPGVVRSLAYYSIIVAGISTVLFNGNPLLRYDGYYMLADLLEIPNLYTRSRAYVGYLAERYLFGRRESEPPQATPGERGWFVGYAVTSFVYRVLVLAAIAFFLLGQVFYLAVGLLILTSTMWLVVPLVRGVRYLAGSPRLRRVRVRAILVSSGAAVAAALLLGVVPVPFRTQAEGVVWVPDEALVRVDSEGFIERLVAPAGGWVKAGDLLVVLRNPELVTRREVLEARVRELRARYDAERAQDIVRSQIVDEELRHALRELGRVRERLDGLALRAGTDGTFVIPQPESLPGRFARKGELLAYVLDLHTLTVRAVVEQEAIDLVRNRRLGIEVRLAERLDEIRVATLTREVPGAREALPSPALGSAGGGNVVVDPRDPQGMTAAGKVFQVDLAVPSPSGLVDVGGRVYVRFDHGHSPLAQQWYLKVRQIFLARFDV
jgi:putative peptide zinc metalloprotease protein